MEKARRSERTGIRRTGAQVAFLRGINVGGKHKLPMAALAEMFTQAGADEVTTYVQSGNVVFTVAEPTVETVAQRVAQAIRERCGFDAPIVIRSAGELEAVVARNPFLEAGTDTGTLHVGFLAEEPEQSRVAQLRPARSPGDSFRVIGRDIFLHLPNGVARSKLTNAYFDTALATTTTIRNWRTVLKLTEIAKAIG